MKKYLFITILAITLTTTGVAMANTGETPIDIIMKLLRFLRTDVEQLQTKTEAIQNQVNGIKSDTNLKVYDATGKEIGLLIDQGMSRNPIVFDTNINKIYEINFYDAMKGFSWEAQQLWYESEDCTGDSLLFVGSVTNPYSLGKNVRGNYYEATDLKKNIIYNSYSYDNGNSVSCTNVHNPGSSIEDFYVIKPLTLPTYQAPLQYAVK